MYKIKCSGPGLKFVGIAVRGRTLCSYKLTYVSSMTTLNSCTVSIAVSKLSTGYTVLVQNKCVLQVFTEVSQQCIRDIFRIGEYLNYFECAVDSNMEN